MDARWPGTTKVTHTLLRYWFQRDADTPTRFHDCQRRAIETLVYVHEILRTPKGDRLRNLGDLYDAVSPSRVDEYEHISKAVEESDYPKLCFKMATGSGKTWVLQAALVWQYFNAIWPEEGSTEFSKHFLVVAPGLVVLERLLDSFLGKKDARGNRDVRTADLTNDLFIPVEWRTQFHLRILGPDDVNPSTSPEEGAFVLLLNWHKLASREDRPNLAVQIFGQDQVDTSETFLAYLSSFPDLVIFNDEAHHVHDKARKGAETDVDARWLEAVKRLRAHVKSLGPRAGLFLQLDFSATPFFGAGMRKEYFPHIVYDYDLKLAMNGYSPIQKKDVPLPLVKQLFLEERQSIGADLATLDFRAVREAQDGKKRGAIAALSQGQLLMLEIGRKKLDQIAREFSNAGLPNKPVMFVACEENDVADMVYNHLRGRMDDKGRSLEDQLLVIHTDAKDRIPEAEWAKTKFLLDSIDSPEVVNPKRVIVSVMMLREGFDVRNICVTVVLRSTDSDILLEQMVGRGLRLMFSGPEFYETKLRAMEEISKGSPPSAALDFLFVVDHPRFRKFYETLRKEGYPIYQGDSAAVITSGDLAPIRADPDRVKAYDIGWPVQFHDEGKIPDPRLIKPETLPTYGKTFAETRKDFDAIVIADRHKATENILSTWGLQTDLFDYSFFLRQVTDQLATQSSARTILSARRAELMELVDNYTSTFLFASPVDFSLEENYRVLVHVPIYDFVISTIRNALVDLLGKVVYEPHPGAIWERVSNVNEILTRSKTSVLTTKSVYPKQSPAPKGGGFESRFMGECLEKSASVLAYAKLEIKHDFRIRYRNEFGIPRDYYPDFLVKTKEKMYLVETKADKDMDSPVVGRKARAAIGWCEAASRTSPPADLDQPKDWEYILLSERTYRLNRSVGFDGVLGPCRAELQRVLTFQQGKLM
jgi:type III restriction enzyme